MGKVLKENTLFNQPRKERNKMNLFVFFALPLATILLSIVLQKVLRSPALVAITFFAIFLIVAFVAFLDNLAEAIIATIIYTIIAYITATIVEIICRYRKQIRCRCTNNNQRSDLLADDSSCLANDAMNRELDTEIISEGVIGESQLKNRPVALGNNIINQNRRYYRR